MMKSLAEEDQGMLIELNVMDLIEEVQTDKVKLKQ